MAIDFRGYGKSTAGAAKEARFEDILAAVRYLRGLGVRRVAVVGASMGGGAAAEAATRAPGDIDRLVLLSPVPIEHPTASIAICHAPRPRSSFPDSALMAYGYTRWPV